MTDTPDLSALIARSRAVAEKATPGPWRYSAAESQYDSSFVWAAPGSVIVAGVQGTSSARNIAQAHPAAWLALLDFVQTTIDAISDDYEPVDVHSIRAALARLTETMGGQP